MEKRRRNLGMNNAFFKKIIIIKINYSIELLENEMKLNVHEETYIGKKSQIT